MSMKIKELSHEVLEKLNNADDKLSVKDVANILGCYKSAVTKRIASGKIRSVRIGQTDYIAKCWLIDYLQNGGGLNNEVFQEKCNEIVAYCIIPRSREEIRIHVGYKGSKYTGRVLGKLIAANRIKQTKPPGSHFQKYVAVAETTHIGRC